jgi:hypothetical protein
LIDNNRLQNRFGFPTTTIACTQADPSRAHLVSCPLDVCLLSFLFPNPGTLLARFAWLMLECLDTMLITFAGPLLANAGARLSTVDLSQNSSVSTNS